MRILVIDDEPLVLRGFARLLGSRGHDVRTASDPATTGALLDAENFDVVLSDISMPGMSGIELLQLLHLRDPDLPVVLMTGGPTLQTAMAAVEHGAIRYLTKPIDPDALDPVLAEAARRGRDAREGRTVLLEKERAEDERAVLTRNFDAALASLWMAYQPIVHADDAALYAYEALARTRTGVFPHPGVLLEAAEQLTRLDELGRTIRRLVASAAAPPERLLFVNLHPRDLIDADLVEPESPLSRIASRVVLEITERAALSEVRDLERRIAALRELGFRIAIDDLGAGYAGLSSLAELEADIVKLDMSLVRGIEGDHRRQRLVRSLVDGCHGAGALVVAEGVETPAERDVVVGLGCDLLQGYLFGKPDATLR